MNISWTAPAAITVPPDTRPEIFYCVEINNGVSTDFLGCNRTGDMNEETSVVTMTSLSLLLTEWEME